MGRLLNQWNEFKRLNSFMFSRDHVRVTWNICGMPYRYVGEGAERVKVDRDRYDQVIDYLSDFFRTYWRNIMVESRCTHPHESVRNSWDGDSDGYWEQHVCSKCHGYVRLEDVDQYLDPKLRRPDLIDYRPCPYVETDEWTDKQLARDEQREYDEPEYYW